MKSKESEEEQGTQTADGPRPLNVSEVVELLVGQAKTRLHYATIPLTNWPSLLVAAIAETSQRIEDLSSCSWRYETGNASLIVRHELTVRTVGGCRLPDNFDSSVFAVLVAQVVARNKTTDGKQGNQDIWLRDILTDLNLDTDNPRDYTRVSEAIQRLCAMSVIALSSIDRAGYRKRDVRVPSNMAMFRLLTSYEIPADSDYQGSPVRLTWNSDAYNSITAVPSVRS